MNSPTETKPDGPIALIIKGALVGIANIIPGVSGGTFALILGIFDRLVGAINALNLTTVKVLFGTIVKGFNKEARIAFVEEWKRIDASFLVFLFIGVAIAIAGSTYLVDYLLKNYPSPTLAFFIGLILPSVAIPWAMMTKRGASLLWVVPGIALTVGVSTAMPESVAGSDNLGIAFATGAISVSAMILPGLSGSYVMLVMGQYQNVISNIKSTLNLVKGVVEIDAIVWLAVFALGLVIGIILFARLLHFLLKKFRSATMAFLIGLLLGSLWVLWPFKDIDSGAQITDSSGEVKDDVKIATAPNRLPESASEGLAAGGAFLGGLVCSATMIVVGKRRKKEPKK